MHPGPAGQRRRARVRVPGSPGRPLTALLAGLAAVLVLLAGAGSATATPGPGRAPGVEAAGRTAVAPVAREEGRPARSTSRPSSARAHRQTGQAGQAGQAGQLGAADAPLTARATTTHDASPRGPTHPGPTLVAEPTLGAPHPRPTYAAPGAPPLDPHTSLHRAPAQGRAPPR